MLSPFVVDPKVYGLGLGLAKIAWVLLIWSWEAKSRV